MDEEVYQRSHTNQRQRSQKDHDLLGGTGKQGDIPPSEYCPEKKLVKHWMKM